MSRRWTPLDRAAGTAQLRLAGTRERNRRAVELLLDAGSDQPDDALVPGLVEQADRAALLDRGVVDRSEGIELHVAFDLAPLTIQLIQLLGQRERALEAVGGEALDSHGHVGQAPGGIDPRADRKAEIRRARRARIAAGDLEQRRDARM